MPDIFTAAGVRLEHVEDWDGDVYQDSDPRTCEYTHFDLSNEQLGQTWRYNCWGFTFLPRRYWINSDTDVDNIIRDNCEPVPDGSVQIGDIIRYRAYDDDLGRLVTEHTGRVWQTDGAGHATLIRSKWGPSAEYIHPPLGGSPYPVPEIYGTDLAYFRQKAPLRGVADLWIKDSSGDNGEQYSEDPWWISPDILIDTPPYDNFPDDNLVFGQTNRIWGVIRNRADQTINGVYVRYYWINPAEGLSPEKWNLIPGTPGYPNPVGPISISGNSSIEAPYVEWNPNGTPTHRCVIAVAYVNDDPKDSNNPDPLVYPFDIRWENNIAVREVSMLVQLQTQSLNFNDIPEGETTVRAVVLSVQSCRAMTFQITNGPTVSSGPVGTSFDTPLGTSTSLETSSLFPTLTREARIWISYTATNEGDVATGTVTIGCIETGEEWIIPITANVIRRPTVVVELVLDKSNSMNFDSGIGPELPSRNDVLKFSAIPFVEIIPEGNAIGVVSFDHDAYLVKHIKSVGPSIIGEGRSEARDAIFTHIPNPEGWTSIGDGLELSHSELEPISGYDIKATIILTDGHENRPKYIEDVRDLINEQVYAIGLGTAENINPAALNTLSNNTGGYMLLTGELGSDDYFRLAKFYMQILAGVTNSDIILDPDGWLAPGQTHRIPFQVTETDISIDVILLTPHPKLIDFLIGTPDGQIIKPDRASASPMILYATGNYVSYYRIKLPVPIGNSQAREGTWHAILNIKGKAEQNFVLKKDSYVIRQSAQVHIPVHGVRYNLNVHTYSNLRLRAIQFQNSYELGSTITIRARMTEYGIPIKERAYLQGELKRPDGTITSIVFNEIEPSVFESSILASMAGVYRFKINAKGTTFQGYPFTREQMLTAAVYHGGDNLPPSSRNDPKEYLNRICHLPCIRILLLLLTLFCIISLIFLFITFR